LANAPDRESVSHGLTLLRRQVEAYVRECRQSLWNLRSPMLEEKDLPSSLGDVGARLAGAAGMAFAVHVIGSPRQAPGRIDDQLLRIAQEAVANAARHSSGRQVTLTLEYRDDAVRLTVNDDGCGFDPDDPMHAASGHWGLVGMEERARTVSGTLRITSGPDTGTQVEVVVPLPHTEARETDGAHQGAVHGRSSDRSRRHRPDHQPAA
ncbi:MAG: ATP-binding protein, partial [Vicinamibacterales bacterium]